MPMPDECPFHAIGGEAAADSPGPVATATGHDAREPTSGARMDAEEERWGGEKEEQHG